MLKFTRQKKNEFFCYTSIELRSNRKEGEEYLTLTLKGKLNLCI